MTYHRIMLLNIFKPIWSNPTALSFCALVLALLLSTPAASQCVCFPCIEVPCECRVECAISCFPEDYPEGPCIPLDGGLGLLVVGGLAYGARSARRRREGDSGIVS